MVDHPEDDDHSFLADAPAPPAPRANRRRWTRGAVLGILAVVVVVVVVGTAVGLVVGSARSDGRAADARYRVQSALSATVSSGSYHFAYELSSTPPSRARQTVTTVTGSCVPPGATNSDTAPCIYGTTPGAPTGPSISGEGIVDTAPFAMVVTASSDNNSLGGATLRVDRAHVSIDNGILDPSPSPGNGGQGWSTYPVTEIPGIEDSSLGPLEGAWATLDLSNPGGYLDLAQNAITSAGVTGMGTVDGAPVTDYRVTLAPSSQAEQLHLSPQESDAVAAGNSALQRGGLLGTTVDMAIDDAGFIRHLVAVSNFASGATVTTTVTLSSFGCAGTVLMPGQTAPGSGTSGCATDPSG